jgi:hypothetical protein
MSELTWVPGALRGMFWIYVALGIVALLVALVRPRTLTGKAGWAAFVLIGFGALPAYLAVGVQENQQATVAVQDRLKAATAHFEARCKTAGEKVTRTVENVDGVVWLKWRGRSNDGDQFKLDDPYGSDCSGDACILGLLRATFGMDANPEGAARHRSGYRYVETIDPTDQVRYRYVAGMELPWTSEQIERHKKETGQDPPAFSYQFTFKRKPITDYSARYGITWDDTSTREDRDYWIAGGSLKVVDLQSKEVIAERTGFMMDRGQGSTAGFRAPWLFAEHTACPAFDRSESNSPIKSSRSRFFIQSVLKSSSGEQK